MFLKTTILLLSAAAAAGQGTFQNLHFESANVPSLPPGDETGGPVATSQGLPGWTVYLETQQQSQVLHNYTYLTLGSVDILGPDWEYVQNGQPGIIDGSYSVYLQSGYEGVFVPASIEQNGTVPATAASLQFKAWEMFGGTFTVSFNGNNLPLTLLSTGQAPSGQMYDVYGANITPYAGETGLLEFTESTLPTSGLSLLLDDISFSTSSVPEPRPLVLISLSGALFALYRRQLKRRTTLPSK